MYSSLSADSGRDFIDARMLLVRYLNKGEFRDLFRELGLADRTQYYYYKHYHYGHYGVDEYADSLLRAWINERDHVVTTGGATWENLKRALESIGHGGAASQI